jgi:hypothetical protein
MASVYDRRIFEAKGGWGKLGRPRFRPNSVEFALSDGVGDQKLHWFGLAAVAADAMEAGLVPEALSRGDDLFGIVVKGREHRAFEDHPDTDDRMGMVAGVCPWWIGDEEETHLPTGQSFDGRRLEQDTCDFSAHNGILPQSCNSAISSAPTVIDWPTAYSIQRLEYLARYRGGICRYINGGPNRE